MLRRRRSPSYDILVVGGYTIDLIFSGLPGLPEAGREVLSSSFCMLPGETCNSVIAMQRLGLQVGWAADFGNDEFSQMALRYLRQEGVSEALFVQHPRPLRRVSVAASLPQERAFITYYDPDPPLPAALKALLTARARALFVPGLYTGKLLEAGKRLARLKQMPLVMDGNSGTDDAEHNPLRLAEPAVRKAVQSADIFLPNAAEARRLTGADDTIMAMRSLAELCPLVVVKDGANGAYALQNDQVVHAPALPLTPLETTGAGDCFNAGFLKAWLDGRPLLECLQWGNILGGLSTQALGGPGYRVSVQEVQEHLKTYPPSTTRQT